MRTTSLPYSPHRFVELVLIVTCAPLHRFLFLPCCPPSLRNTGGELHTTFTHFQEGQLRTSLPHGTAPVQPDFHPCDVSAARWSTPDWDLFVRKHPMVALLSCSESNATFTELFLAQRKQNSPAAPCSRRHARPLGSCFHIVLLALFMRLLCLCVYMCSSWSPAVGSAHI